MLRQWRRPLRGHPREQPCELHRLAHRTDSACRTRTVHRLRLVLSATPSVAGSGTEAGAETVAVVVLCAPTTHTWAASLLPTAADTRHFRRSSRCRLQTAAIAHTCMSMSCICICMCMCAWAERVHASVRTPGGRTGIREPGTPVGPGVSARVARARLPVSVKECAPPLLTCQGVRPAVSLYVLRAARLVCVADGCRP